MTDCLQIITKSCWQDPQNLATEIQFNHTLRSVRDSEQGIGGFAVRKPGDVLFNPLEWLAGDNHGMAGVMLSGGGGDQPVVEESPGKRERRCCESAPEGKGNKHPGPAAAWAKALILAHPAENPTDRIQPYARGLIAPGQRRPGFGCHASLVRSSVSGGEGRIKRFGSPDSCHGPAQRK